MKEFGKSTALTSQAVGFSAISLEISGLAFPAERPHTIFAHRHMKGTGGGALLTTG